MKKYDLSIGLLIVVHPILLASSLSVSAHLLLLWLIFIRLSQQSCWVLVVREVVP